MPKLYFRYGTMNSSKTANLLMVAHNYESQNRNILLLKPEIDTRYGTQEIGSRAIGTQKADDTVDPRTDDFEIMLTYKPNIECVLVDEAQFLSTDNVNGLRKLAEHVPVICYGLRTDYRSLLFPGSKRLLELADSIEEIKTVCKWCHRKAIINAKFRVNDDGGSTVVRCGSDSPEIGAEDRYMPLCYKCWEKSG